MKFAFRLLWRIQEYYLHPTLGMKALEQHRVKICSIMLICFSLIAFDQLFFNLLHDFVYAQSTLAQLHNHDQMHTYSIDHAHGSLELLLQEDSDNPQPVSEQDVKQQLQVLPKEIAFEELEDLLDRTVITFLDNWQDRKLDVLSSPPQRLI